jgi:hypothetical protein
MNPFRAMLRTVRTLEQLPELFIEEVGHLSVRLAEEGFELQVDPYGEWWAPTVTGKSFDQRDGLKNALRVSRFKLKGLMILNLDHKAFIFHQTGSVYVWGSIPSRLMVPVVKRGLGKWAAEYHELAASIWHRLIEKARTGG